VSDGAPEEPRTEYPPHVPPPAPDTLRRLSSRAGFLASAFAVFTCGWLAMRTDDWKRMILYSVLALGAAALASAFSRRSR
jgi:NADH:ubiquinone oxidoreductase subunit 4 (subunit M)